MRGPVQNGNMEHLVEKCLNSWKTMTTEHETKLRAPLHGALQDGTGGTTMKPASL